MKKEKEVKNSKTLLLLFQLLIISLGFSNFYFYIGYSIKPYMIVLLFIIGYFIKTRNYSIKGLFTYEKCLFCFFIVASLTVLQFRYPVPVLRYIFAFIFISVLYFTVRKTCYLLSKKDIENAISNAGIIISISSIIYYILGLFAFNFNFHCNGIEKFGIVCDRGIPRLITLFNADPNISVFVTTLFFFYFFCHLKEKKSKLGFILTGAMIILTFSRGAYIGIILPIIFLIFKDKSRSFIKKILLMFVMIASLFVFNGIMNHFFNISITDTISSRFSGLSQDSGSGRIILWENAFDTFLNHPIFGIGINSTIYYSNPVYGSDHYVHNVYLEVLSETGIVGFILYFLFIILTFMMFNKVYKNDKSVLFLQVTFLSYIVQMIFVSVLLTEMMYIMLAISFRFFLDSYESHRQGEIMFE